MSTVATGETGRRQRGPWSASRWLFSAWQRWGGRIQHIIQGWSFRVVVAVLLLLATVITLWFYAFGRSRLYAAMRGELMALARTGAALVDADQVTAVRPGDENTAAYQALRRYLEQIRAASPHIRYVYILQPTENPELFRFLVDADPEDPAAIGEELDAREYPDLVAAVDGPAADHAITEDRWGKWLSGYAPIRRADGQTVAVLGLDLPATDVVRAVNWLKVVSFGFGLTAVISAVVAGRWLSRRITRRLRDLQAHVSALAQRVPETGRLPVTGSPADTQALVDYYEALVARLEASREELDHLFRQTLTALTAAVKTRDTYTADHSKGVARLVEALAERLGVPADDRVHLRYAAALHDIGKIGIPDHILLKPGPLTPEERVVIEQHPRQGYDLLVQVEALRRVAEIVLSHHERWDGRGYPQGLAGNEIPLSARIISVVDAFSAITTDRPYRSRRSMAEAVAELERMAGTQFDPTVVACLVDVLERQQAAAVQDKSS